MQKGWLWVPPAAVASQKGVNPEGLVKKKIIIQVLSTRLQGRQGNCQPKHLSAAAGMLIPILRANGSEMWAAGAGMRNSGSG